MRAQSCQKGRLKARRVRLGDDCPARGAVYQEITRRSIPPTLSDKYIRSSWRRVGGAREENKRRGTLSLLRYREIGTILAIMDFRILPSFAKCPFSNGLRNIYVLLFHDLTRSNICKEENRKYINLAGLS